MATGQRGFGIHALEALNENRVKRDYGKRITKRRPVRRGGKRR